MAIPELTYEPRFEKFPTREDIKTALDNLNQSLDDRFSALHELLKVEADHLKEKIQLQQEQFDRRFSADQERFDRRLTADQEQTNLRISALERLMTAINEASEKAISKADTANEKRFESVNEFRAQMADQSALFISRREVESLVNSNAEKIAAVTDRINRNEGRSMGIGQLAGWIFGGVGLVVGLVTIFVWLSSMQPKVERNSEFRQQIAPIVQPKVP